MKRFFSILVTVIFINLLCTFLHAQNPQWMHFSGGASITQMVNDGNHLWLVANFDAIDYNIQTGSYLLYKPQMYPVPVNTVRGIAKDSNGKIWFTTELGLLCKNGNNWTVYNTSNSEIPSNDTQKIIIDHNNVIWLETNLGLSRFDGTTWTNFNSNTLPFSISLFSTMTVDQSNNLWTANMNYNSQRDMVQLYKYNGNDWIFVPAPFTEYAGGTVRQLRFNSQNQLWVGTSDGAWAFDGNQWTQQLSMRNIFDIQFDSEDHPWLGTIGMGIAYNLGNGWAYYSPSNTPMNNYDIYSLLFDDTGRLWVGTSNNYRRAELLSHDGATWIDHTYYDISFLFNGVNCIAVDDANNKWFGTQSGLMKFDNAHWTQCPEPIEYLYSNSIEHISCDHLGNVWVVYGYGQIGKYDGNEWILYDVDDVGFNIGSITSMTTDAANTLWLTTGDSGIIKYDGMNWSSINTTNSSIPSDNVWLLAIDTQGTLWISFATGGVSSCINDEWTLHPLTSETWSQEADYRITSIFFDNNNALWAVAQDTYYGSGNSVIATLNNNEFITWGSYIFSTVNDAISDMQGAFWLLTNDTSYNTGIMQINNDFDYIFHTQIVHPRSIAVDHSNNVWIGQWQRISVFNQDGVVQTNDPCMIPNPSFFNLTNYPNPFNPATTIAFDLKFPAQVQMKIYNIKGQLVKTLCSEKKQVNSYKIEWNGKDEDNKLVASGIYFCRIQVGDKSEMKKMMLIK